MAPWLCVLLVLIAGFGAGIQGPANGALARAWDLPRSILLNGGIVCLGALIVFLVFRRPMETLKPVPWTQLIGGFCGLFLIAIAAISVPRIGAAVFTTVIFLGMTAAALLVDHYGWFGQAIVPVTATRLLGIALILAGVVLVRWTS